MIQLFRKKWFAITTEDSLSLTSPKPTADISNMKIEDTDIFYGRLNETSSVPPECICTSSESSQEDTVSGN